MTSERSLLYWQRARPVEALLLLLAAPFLLFPERYVLLTTLSLVLLATLWVTPLFIIKRPLIPQSAVNTVLFPFFLSVCVSILISSDPDLTLPKATGLILGVGVWRFLILFIQKRSTLYWGILGYIAVGLGFIAIGILNANWSLKSASQVPALGGLLSQTFAEESSMLGSPAIHPNQIAAVITLVFPLLLAISLGPFNSHHRRVRFARLFVLSATVFSCLTLIFTQSRSGWIGALVGSVALIVVRGLTSRRPETRRRTAIGAATISAILLSILAILGPDRIRQFSLQLPQESAVGSLSTLEFRQELWPWAVQTIEDFPLTGVGLGAFRSAARRLYPIQILPEYDLAHAHNAFLQVGVDLGLLGLVAYLSVLMVSATIAWQVAQKDLALRPFGLGLLASLVAFHVFGLTDALALGSKPSVLLWAIFGILAAMANLPNDPAGADEG